MKKSNDIKNMVITAIFTAIILMMSFIPFLGYIPLGIMNATIIHIPVMLGAILLGPKKGAFLGLVFGLTSLFKNTYMPNATSFVFSPFIKVGEFGGDFNSLIVCLVPRILVGLIAYFLYRFFIKLLKEKRQMTCLMLSGVIGSLAHTILVMNFIYFLFGQEYANALNWGAVSIYGTITGIVFSQGILEAIVAGIFTSSIGKILIKQV